MISFNQIRGLQCVQSPYQKQEKWLRGATPADLFALGPSLPVHDRAMTVVRKQNKYYCMYCKYCTSSRELSCWQFSGPCWSSQCGMLFSGSPPAKLGRTPGQDQFYMVFCLCSMHFCRGHLDPLYCTNPQLLYNIYNEDNQ